MAFVPNTKDDKWHGFTKISEVPLGWDNVQRAKVNQALRGIGRQTGPPHLITHGRANLANTAWQNESSYTEEELTRDYQVQKMADELGLSYAAVDAQVEFTVYAEGGTLDESLAEANQDIAANLAEWETPES
jgi:hypothetical protein